MKIARLVSAPFEVNVFVVSEGERAFVVDSSSGLDWATFGPKVLQATRGLRVEGLFLTHLHVDHVGAAARLAKIVDAPVLMHEDEAIAVETGDATLTGGALFGVPQEACPVRRVKTGETLDLAGRRLEVLCVPGHSPAHAALWDREARALWSGDVVFEGGSFGRVDLPGAEPREMIRSLERLAGLDPVSFYPGHMRPVVTNARDAILESLDVARAMLT